ncbi:MAG: cytochrome ubiquinol oxidase subunit I, partial [Chthoniobacterales bacterium]|nr:cytochrome ubiquinol oxidase subunit I [Chthoniobacterales bacterium]
MNYPVWNVPYIGSGLVIGMVAIVHVLVSHFAIGGGLFLYLTEKKALREGREDWLKRLPGYSKFFLVLTGVVGAMTGVGIWFSIGLANPAGTSTLIHNFVFGWATEWVIFLVELSLAAAYYYTWGRLPSGVHVRLGLLYAVSSFLTLVIINGILTFKLTPSSAWLSVAGTGKEAEHFFEAFFNPTYWPSLALRTLVCISMGGVMSLV